MNLGQFFNILQNEFNLTKSDSLNFISQVTKLNKSEIINSLQNELLLDEKINKLLSKIKQGYPLAYLFKEREFFNLDFFVDERVLIPRLETELLVDYVIQNNKKDFPLILDLCTGSGAILLSLINNIENSKGIGVDISFEAIQVAKINTKKFGFEDKVDFICADVFQIEKIFNKKFDLILCNPPYISKDENFDKSIMFEPSIALFAKENGLIFYKKVLSIIDKLCNKGGLVCFEIGYKQKEDLEKIGFNFNKDLIFIRDYADNDRIMVWKN